MLAESTGDEDSIYDDLFDDFAEDHTNFRIVKKTQLDELIECIEGTLQRQRERIIGEIERSRLALNNGNDEEDDEYEEDEEEDDDDGDDKDDDGATSNATVVEGQNETEKLSEGQATTGHFSSVRSFVAILTSLLLVVLVPVILVRKIGKMAKQRDMGDKMQSETIEKAQSYRSGKESSSDSDYKEQAMQQNNRKAKKMLKDDKSNKPADSLKVKLIQEEILGYGSSGTVVYAGIFQERQVAVKRVLKTHNVLATKEVEILLKSDHPNIIKYYFYQEDKYV